MFFSNITSVAQTVGRGIVEMGSNAINFESAATAFSTLATAFSESSTTLVNGIAQVKGDDIVAVLAVVSFVFWKVTEATLPAGEQPQAQPQNEAFTPEEKEWDFWDNSSDDERYNYPDMRDTEQSEVLGSPATIQTSNEKNWSFWDDSDND